MSKNIRILCFAGSARADSCNKKLAQLFAREVTAAGGQATFIDLAEYELPLFDQDSEAAHGFPKNVLKLKELFNSHQGLFIASPEYNSSITPMLKNVIDWVSRTADGETPLQAYKGKTAAIMSASPGALGGLRGLVHLRAILSNIQVLVIPDQLAVSKAFEAFNDAGALSDENSQKMVKQIAAKLLRVTSALSV